MNVGQVAAYYRDKEHAPCPLTERLVGIGYRQTGGGYISYAAECGIEDPTQYWHLMEAYCAFKDASSPFTRAIQCGELIFWMAEAAGCVDSCALEALVDAIEADAVRDTQGRPVYDRRKWNRAIQDVCFDSIVRAVEGTAG